MAVISMKVQELFNLKDRVAIITGGCRGIGAFIAHGLGEAGANLVIADRKLDLCQQAADELKSFGISVLLQKCDMSNEHEISDLVKMTMTHFGKIDILVNNAGITWNAPTDTYPMDKWDQVMAVNAKGPFLLARLVGKYMKKAKWGRIINISSILAFSGGSERLHPTIAYCASKGALTAWSRDLAIKWVSYNITVNALVPGYFKTDMLKPAEVLGLELELIEGIPMRRMGGELDIKGVAVFLASEASRYITGQSIIVDGGYLAC